MTQMLTLQMLKAENQLFTGTGGVSEENQCRGFVPGFLDRETGILYSSRWADGSPAPLHTLDGLPQHLVRERDSRGHITAVKPSVISGFIRQGHFYTREQVAYCLD